MLRKQGHPHADRHLGKPLFRMVTKGEPMAYSYALVTKVRLSAREMNAYPGAKGWCREGELNPHGVASDGF